MKKNQNKNNMGYYIDLYLESSFIKNKRSTTTTYQYVIKKHIYPYFKDYTRDMIDIREILQFIHKLRSNGLNNKSIRDILLVLKGIFKLMDLSFSIPMPKLDKKEIKILSKEHQFLLEQYLLEHLSPLSFGIYLTLYTGLRIGEVCALNINDFDFENQKILIHHTLSRVLSENNNSKTKVILSSPKSLSSIREIPLPIFMIPLLKRLSYQENSYILTNKNTFMDTRTLLYHYKSILKELNLGSYTFHTLRHTFATRCIKEGCDPKTLSLLLGHSSIKITLDLYVHPSLENKKSFMNQLKPFYG